MATLAVGSSYAAALETLHQRGEITIMPAARCGDRHRREDPCSTRAVPRCYPNRLACWLVSPRCCARPRRQYLRGGAYRQHADLEREIRIELGVRDRYEFMRHEQAQIGVVQSKQRLRAGGRRACSKSVVPGTGSRRVMQRALDLHRAHRRLVRRDLGEPVHATAMATPTCLSSVSTVSPSRGNSPVPMLGARRNVGNGIDNLSVPNCLSSPIPSLRPATPR